MAAYVIVQLDITAPEGFAHWRALATATGSALGRHRAGRAIGGTASEPSSLASSVATQPACPIRWGWALEGRHAQATCQP